MVETESKKMSIGEVAKKTGLSIDTLRYYEKEGLLPFIPRTEGGIRVFDENHLGAIRFLTKLKLTGMPISHIREYMESSLLGSQGQPRQRDLLIEHRLKVLDQIAELNLNLKILDLKIDLYQSGWTPGDWSDPRAGALRQHLEQTIPEINI